MLGIRHQHKPNRNMFGFRPTKFYSNHLLEPKWPMITWTLVDNLKNSTTKLTLLETGEALMKT